MAESAPDPTAEYPPYSGDDATCPKCTVGTMLTHFEPVSTRWLHQGSRRLWTGASEWLLRKCDNCGFERPEQCADSPGGAR